MKYLFVCYMPIAKGQRIMLSFSAYANLRKLFNFEERGHGLDMVDGLRVLAICWIILGHRFEMSLQFPALSMIHFEKVQQYSIINIVIRKCL